MTKTENAILASKTPQEYIDRSLKARLTPAAKAKLARLWMESTGYTKEDILRARNRHPYWKKKKMEGSAERTKKRLEHHDYSGGLAVQWNEGLVSEFLGLNKKMPDGRYMYKDWQLAEHFGATIPSIQYMRRKYSKVSKLLGSQASRSKMVEYLLRAESVLSRGKAAVERLKAVEKGKVAPGSKSVSKTTAKSAKKTAAKKKTTAAKSSKARSSRSR
jgi:hypothetical protein